MILAPITAIRRRTTSLSVAAWCAAALLGTSPAFAAEPPVRRPAQSAARPRAKVDHAVVPAGGVHCQHCGPEACPPHRGHLAGCRDGACEPHCPVRPSQYGYYRTQWRRWPGQDVVPVNAEEAVTPALPPKAQVPTADEESPQATVDEAVPPDSPAEGDPTTEEEPPRKRADDALLTDPIPENPGVDAAAPTERPASPLDAPSFPKRDAPVPPVPPGETPVSPASGGDAGLFDQSALPPVELPEPTGLAAMRYPEPVGRSIATGAEPWRLEPASRQRPAGSARGL